jgi:hypothetical protein
MNSEIIRNVAYDNYDDFQHANSIFSQNFISLLWGLVNDEIDLRVRWLANWKTCTLKCNHQVWTCPSNGNQNSTIYKYKNHTS